MAMATQGTDFSKADDVARFWGASATTGSSAFGLSRQVIKVGRSPSLRSRSSTLPSSTGGQVVGSPSRVLERQRRPRKSSRSSCGKVTEFGLPERHMNGEGSQRRRSSGAYGFAAVAATKRTSVVRAPGSMRARLRSRERLLSVEDVLSNKISSQSTEEQEALLGITRTPNGGLLASFSVGVNVPGYGFQHRTVEVTETTSALELASATVRMVPYLQCLYQFPEQYQLSIEEPGRLRQTLPSDAVVLRELLKWTPARLAAVAAPAAQPNGTTSVKVGLMVRIKPELPDFQRRSPPMAMRTRAATCPDDISRDRKSVV